MCSDFHIHGVTFVSPVNYRFSESLKTTSMQTSRWSGIYTPCMHAHSHTETDRQAYTDTDTHTDNTHARARARTHTHTYTHSLPHTNTHTYRQTDRHRHRHTHTLRYTGQTDRWTYWQTDRQIHKQTGRHTHTQACTHIYTRVRPLRNAYQQYYKEETEIYRAHAFKNMQTYLAT